MGFFDTLGKKATEAYNVTTKKTGELAKEAKLRMKINENKSNIKDLYEEIGKKVYEKHVREENIDINTDLEEECTKIDVLSAEIETCLKSILELKEKKQCENCHAEIELNASFCPKCGEKQPVEEVKVAEVVDADVADSAETQDSVENQTSESSEEETPKTEENSEAENTVEKVTEVMSQETQENAKEEMGGNTDNQ